MAVPSRAAWPVLPERLLRGFPDRWFPVDLADVDEMLERSRMRLEEFRDGDLCIRAERRERTILEVRVPVDEEPTAATKVPVSRGEASS